MKKLMKWLLAGAVLVAAVVWFFREPLSLRMMESVVRSNLQSGTIDTLSDGLHVALCGTGSPLPDTDRSGPCTAVIAGERVFIVDAGSGASSTLARMQLSPGLIEAVLLTHFHSDHIDGLGELNLQRWVNGSHTERMPVYGPDGVALVVNGLAQAYSMDRDYRVAHHGDDIVPESGGSPRAIQFRAPPDGEATTIIDDDGLRVTAFRVLHDPVEPAVGYRFDYGGRSVVVSGDTSKSSNLVQFAEGADILVHEALSFELVRLMSGAAAAAGNENASRIFMDILDYHTSPVEAAEVASEAGVGQLVLTHIVPPLPVSALEGVFMDGVEDAWPGPVTLGEDGMLFSLPSGEDSVEQRSVL